MLLQLKYTVSSFYSVNKLLKLFEEIINQMV